MADTHFISDAARGVYSALSIRQVGILCEIAKAATSSYSVKDLAEIMGCGKPAVTRAADMFERLGLATRRRNPNDGRLVVLRATERGRAFVAPLVSEAA